VALILFGVLFLGVSDAQLVPPLLPAIAEAFRTTSGQAGIVVTSYSLAAAGFALFAGPLSDRVGRKRVLAAGLALFAAASFLTYQVNTLTMLVLVRALTGFAAGTLSTCALSYAGDHYGFQQRGRAMGILSMGYFLAFVLGAPLGAMMIPRWGWSGIFVVLASVAVLMAILVLGMLPSDSGKRESPSWLPHFGSHFQDPARMAGIVAAFLTSGGLVGYLTYIGAWLRNDRGVSFDQLALVLMLSGIAAVAASPVAGWLSDHAGKLPVIIGANLALAPMFLVAARLDWGGLLWAAIALLGIAASARQAPLHAVTMEIVGPETRGEYTAVRNAASQVGIAVAASISAYAYDYSGFTGVSIVAAAFTILIPITCHWLKTPLPKGEGGRRPGER
jgi:DHA1 family inner membrane transport protein